MSPTLFTSCNALDASMPEARILHAVQIRAGGFGAAALSPEGAAAPAAPAGVKSKPCAFYKAPCDAKRS